MRLGFLETQHLFPQGSVFAIPCANTVHRGRMINSCIGLKCGNLVFSITLFTLIMKYDLSSLNVRLQLFVNVAHIENL